MQKYCLVLFGTLNTEWKWKWIMNVYRQDCSKFENLEKWPCCCCCWISIRPWSPLELLTELTKALKSKDIIEKNILLNSWISQPCEKWTKTLRYSGWTRRCRRSWRKSGKYWANIQAEPSWSPTTDFNTLLPVMTSRPKRWQQRFGRCCFSHWCIF